MVEILVLLGFIGIVSIGISTLFSQMNIQVLQASNRSDRQGLQFQLAAALRSPVSCFNNMSSISLGSTASLSLTNIKQYNDAAVAVSTVIPGIGVPTSLGSRLTVSSISLGGAGGVGLPGLVRTSGAVNTYSSSLIVSFEAPNNGTVGLKPIIVHGITVKTDLDGVFQSCEMSTDPAILCVQMGMTWNAVTSVCNPSLATACAVIGGTVVGTTCVPPNIISKDCGSGQVQSGYSAAGVPVCVAAASPPPAPAPAPPPAPPPPPVSYSCTCYDVTRNYSADYTGTPCYFAGGANGGYGVVGVAAFNYGSASGFWSCTRNR